MAKKQTTRGRKQDRFWWYQLTNTDYVPPIFSTLSRREWQIMKAWYRDSERVKGRLEDRRVRLDAPV